jgi:hypothetical protein
MEMRRRFWVVNSALLLILIGVYGLFQRYDVEFLRFVVERTVMEKLGPDVPPGPVRERFARYRQWSETGRLSRADYRTALLDAAAYVEKVEVLEAPDVERIGQYFERGVQ